MTAISIQQELEEDVAQILFGLNTGGVMKSVLIQVTPQNDLDIFESFLSSGPAPVAPFWSVSSVLPETYSEKESFNDRSCWIRPVTVVLYAPKLDVMKNKKLYQFARQVAMRRLDKNRWQGTFDSDAQSCMLKGIVRPKSHVEAAAWLQGTGFVSAFDVVVKTLEPFG